MADKQLTVAELMARAEKENPDAQPRRRRRRSLEDGGVSVAELTGSLKAVDARPAEVKHSSVPIDEPEEAPATTLTKFVPAEPKPTEPADEVDVPESAAEPAAEGVTLRKVSFAEPEGDAEPAVAPEDLPVDTFPRIEPEDVAAANEARDTGDTGVMPVVEDREEALPDRDVNFSEQAQETTQEHPLVDVPEDEPVYEDYADYEGEVDNSVNPIMLVLLVFAGLLIGVLVFLGFQYLWGALPSLLVAVLALAATAGIVFLVRSMKTGRDGLTLTLAAIAGAVMTFGPAAITML